MISEPAPKFLRRGAVVVAVLLAVTGLAVVLTSRHDTETARELCADGARTQFSAPAEITAVDRTGDDTFVVRGTAGTRTFTCMVIREPMTDQWELTRVA